MRLASRRHPARVIRPKPLRFVSLIELDPAPRRWLMNTGGADGRRTSETRPATSATTSSSPMKDPIRSCRARRRAGRAACPQGARYGHERVQASVSLMMDHDRQPIRKAPGSAWRAFTRLTQLSFPRSYPIVQFPNAPLILAFRLRAARTAHSRSRALLRSSHLLFGDGDLGLPRALSRRQRAPAVARPGVHHLDCRTPRQRTASLAPGTTCIPAGRRSNRGPQPPLRSPHPLHWAHASADATNAVLRGGVACLDSRGAGGS
jgi:hypothetical protein